MAEPVIEDLLRAKIQPLADIIGVPSAYVIDFDPGQDMAHPYVKFGPGEDLHWMVKERGEIIADRVTRDVEELLYWIFESVTFFMAVTWEAGNRVGDQDFRIAMWSKQQELLAALNPDWAMRRRNKLLRTVPDAVGLLSGQGGSSA